MNYKDLSKDTSSDNVDEIRAKAIINDTKVKKPEY